MTQLSKPELHKESCLKIFGGPPTHERKRFQMVTYSKFYPSEYMGATITRIIMREDVFFINLLGRAYERVSIPN